MASSDSAAQTSGGRRLTPLLVDLGGWDALVVGGGTIGTRRARTLAEAGAAVHVVSPEVSPEIDDLEGAGRLRISRRPFATDDLERRHLVVAATGDAAVDEHVRTESARAGVLCNVAADAQRCDVIFPSTVRRGPLVLAVSSGGSSPALAARARELVSEAIGPEWGELAELLDETRGDLRDAYPDAAERRAVIDDLLDSGVLELLASGQHEDARAQVRAAVGGR